MSVAAVDPVTTRPFIRDVTTPVTLVAPDRWKPGDLIDLTTPTAFQLLDAPPRSLRYERWKRFSDVTLAAVLLVVTAPLFAAIAIMIRIESRGPVLFRQQRVGQDLQPFEFIKFRTMHVDARRRHPEQYHYRFDPAAVRRMHFKHADDPRLTRVGRWIRRTSLDELPNLLCVLRGDMSLVGPRPEIPEMLPYYRPEELNKFGVLPGVTGLAQVSGRNILLWGQTNALDVEYLHRRGTVFDCWLLVRTVASVVGMVGAL